MENLTLAELEKMHERLEQAHLKYPDHSDIKKEVTNAIYGSVENMFDYLDWFCNKRQPIVYMSTVFRIGVVLVLGSFDHEVRRASSTRSPPKSVVVPPARCTVGWIRQGSARA